MSPTLDRALPSLPFLPPNLQPWLLVLGRWLLPHWLRWRCRITHVETRHVDRLLALTQQFEAGKVRYLLAFRHPCTDDQYCLLHLLGHALPTAARQQGVRLQRTPHMYFVYDRGIPLWAGDLVAWLFPRVGGIPIYRGKLDRQGLATIRQHLVEGSYPVAIAPEGGTNNHNELVSPIEPGVAQLGFWATEALADAGRDERVAIVPIGIQYQHTENIWPRLDRLLMQLERESGLHLPPMQPQERYQRLYALGEYLIGTVADHYQKYYPSFGADPLPAADFTTRLQALLDRILRVAESSFGIKPNGTFIDRCRRLEQAGWDRIFRSDIDNLDRLSPLARGFADRLAVEANTAHWHMRLAESITAVTGSYVVEHPSPDRFADTLISIWRAMARVKSQPFGAPPYLGKRKATIAVGEPLWVSDRLAEYRSGRAAARGCVRDLTQDLHRALTDLIEPSPLTL